MALKYLCGEDASLIYIIECEYCGAIVVHDLTNEDCLHPSAKFCPLCEAQPDHYYERVYSAAEIRADEELTHWINVSRIMGTALCMTKTTSADFIIRWEKCFSRISWNVHSSFLKNYALEASKSSIKHGLPESSKETQSQIEQQLKDMSVGKG